jgi:VIT1/CCC1 family predicted Fe2+/Mn2+ transporter
MSTLKRRLPSILFFVAGVLFLFAAFVPRDKPMDGFLVVIGIAMLLLAMGTWRRADARPPIAD